MEHSQEYIDRLHIRLDALRLADSAFQVFGTGEHRYHMDAPMTEAEIQAFEELHAIVLPEEYRTFLRTMGREHEDKSGSIIAPVMAGFFPLPNPFLIPRLPNAG